MREVPLAPGGLGHGRVRCRGRYVRAGPGDCEGCEGCCNDYADCDVKSGHPVEYPCVVRPAVAVAVRLGCHCCHWALSSTLPGSRSTRSSCLLVKLSKPTSPLSTWIPAVHCASLVPVAAGCSSPWHAASWCATSPSPRRRRPSRPAWHRTHNM